MRLWHTVHNQPGLEAAQESFLAGYASTRRERWAAARLYEAIELVKITARRVQLFDPEWATYTERLIRRVQGMLNDLDLATKRQAYRPEKPGPNGRA